jgi:putative hydrolase of the HAD superfamily
MIDWKHIDTVLLDMDGTLLDLHYDNYFWHHHLPEKWGALHGLDAEAARERLVPRFRSRAGTLSWYCLDYWTAELGLDILGLKNDVEHLIRTRPYAVEFLEFLRGLRKRVVLVTNAHEKLLDIKLRRTEIGAYFDAVVSAHRLGRPKEEVEFWEALRGMHPFDPQRTLLIDDNQDVLKAAAGFGIRHLLTIAQPDSQRPARARLDFTAIASFEGLLGAGE